MVASIYGVKEKTIKMIQQSGLCRMIKRSRDPVAPAPVNVELGTGQQQSERYQNRTTTSSNQVKTKNLFAKVFRIYEKSLYHLINTLL